MNWQTVMGIAVNSAREQILKRLHQNRVPDSGEVPLFVPRYDWTHEQRIEKFCQHIQAVHAEVHQVKKEHWLGLLLSLLEQKSVTQLLMSQSTEVGKEVAANHPDSIRLREYKQPLENWKADFFSGVQAGLTTTKGAISETGSLILWPTVQEPRLMSLIPPIHIAVLDAESIYDTFAQAVQEQGWVDTMPSNALLISGPSKTADIEQVLAYGVHGPKELVIIIRD